MSSRPGHELPEHIVARPQDLPAVCEHLAACGRFGFDTEFVGEDTYHPHLCLVQVATSERLILIDPLFVGPLDAFWALVTDPAIQVIVHAGREEVRLCRLWGRASPANLFDLQIAAGLVGLAYPLGHGALVNQVLGIQLAKAETLTEWRDRPLTKAQIRYAFDDVRYLLPVWRELHGRLEARRRLDWAREEFERLSGNVEPEEAPVERWRKLRGAGSLDRRRFNILRALHAWRDQAAARLNRPARTVCRDDLLVEIARRNPTRARELEVIRGLARREHAAILQAVADAQQLPVESWPVPADKEQDPPRLNLLANILLAVLADFCVRQALAPSLVASSADVRQLVRAHLQGSPLPPESPFARGWRSQRVLPVLQNILEGRELIRIADVQSEAPLELRAGDATVRGSADRYGNLSPSETPE